MRPDRRGVLRVDRLHGWGRERRAPLDQLPLSRGQLEHEAVDSQCVHLALVLQQRVHRRADAARLFDPVVTAVGGVQDDARQARDPSGAGVREQGRMREKVVRDLLALLPAAAAILRRQQVAEFTGNDGVVGIEELDRHQDRVLAEVLRFPARPLVGARQQGRPAADDPVLPLGVAGNGQGIGLGGKFAGIPFGGRRISHPDLAIEVQRHP